MTRNLLVAGALLAAAGVALGAFGAHALRGSVDASLLAVWQTATQYHLVHALAIVVLGFASLHWQSRQLAIAGWILFAGVLLFSGSLYVLVLLDLRWLGAVTPLGGIAFIAGWLWRAVAVRGLSSRS